jgi:membrane-associated phospholipid phosphatase
MQPQIRKATPTMLNSMRRHPIISAACYELFFFISFWLLELMPRNYYIIHFSLDQYVPFCRYAIVPYMMWFAWNPLIFALLFLFSIREFWRAYDAFAIGSFATLIIYTVFPTGLNLRQPLEGDDIFTRMILYLRTTDNPYNVCPSLHVFTTVLLLLAILDSKVLRAVWLRIVTVIISVAICASTVLLDQHSLIDVFAAIILAIVCYSIVRARYEAKPLPFNSLREVSCPKCLLRMSDFMKRLPIFA